MSGGAAPCTRGAAGGRVGRLQGRAPSPPCTTCGRAGSRTAGRSLRGDQWAAGGSDGRGAAQERLARAACVRAGHGRAPAGAGAPAGAPIAPTSPTIGEKKAAERGPGRRHGGASGARRQRHSGWGACIGQKQEQEPAAAANCWLTHEDGDLWWEGGGWEGGRAEVGGVETRRPGDARQRVAARHVLPMVLLLRRLGLTSVINST